MSPRGGSRGALRVAAWAIACAAVLSCAGSELAPEAARVTVLDAEADASCALVGHARAKTSPTVGIFARRPEKVEKELRDLAREEAARMGGNAIAPEAPPTGGEQSFRVYRCGRS